MRVRVRERGGIDPKGAERRLLLDTGVTPARSVDDNTSQATRDDTCDGEGNDPTTVDPGNHAPVDGAPGTGTETDTDSGTSNALSGGDGELCKWMC